MAADAQVSVVAELVAKVDSAVAGFNTAANEMHSALQKMKEHVNSTMGETSTLMVDKAKEGGAKAGEASAASFNESFRTGLLAAAAYIGAEFLKTVQEKVEEAAAYATHLNILQVETGASKEELQRLTYAFQSVGLSGDNAGMAVARMGRAIEQAAAMGNGRSIIERMGLDPAKLKGETFQQQFNAIADAISNLKNQDDKLSAATQLFGRSGATAMLPLLDQGADAINKVAASADAAGAVLESGLTNKLEDLHVAMMQAGTTARNFYAEIASPFIGPITEGIRAVQQMRAEFQKLSDQAKGSVLFAALAATAIAFEKLLDVVKSLKIFPTFLNEVLVKMSAFLEPVAMIIAILGLLWNAWQTDFGGIRAVTQQVFTAILSLIDDFKNAAQWVIDTFGPSFKDIFNQLSSAIAPILSQFAQLFDEITRIIPVQTILTTLFGTLAAIIYGVLEVILYLIKAINAIMDAAQKLFAYLLQSWADLGHAEADALQGVANFLAAIPGLNGMADAVSGVADQFNRAADAAQRLAQGDGVMDTSGGSYGSWAVDPKAKPKKKPTGEINKVPTGNAAGEAAKEAISAIKDALEPFKDALKDAEAQIKELDVAMKKLGDIDTPSKLAAGQKIFNEQLAATSKELREQHALTVASHAGAAKLSSLEKGSKDPKIAREYHNASRSLTDEALNSHQKELELELKLIELKKEKNKQELDYLKLMEEGSNTYAGRIKWLEREAALMVQMHASAKALNEVHKQILETIQKQDEAAEQAAEAPLKANAATATRHKQLLEAGVHGVATATETPQGKQALAIAEAQDSLTDANDQLAIAELKAKEASENLAAAQRAHVTDEDKMRELNRAVAETAQLVADAQTKQLVATQDLTNAQTQLSRDAMQTFNTATKTVTDSLLGPFASAVKDITTEIAGGMNPGTAILSSMFAVLAKDSRAYNDIQKVLTSVAEALAKVFDLMRPVVDLLLGVLTGVVNMFIGLFNVIATILNVFGLHIQRIQAVNDQLAIMGTSLPLLQITHDLPTANEYNQGKWGPLITQQMQQAQNSLNNNLTVGFNNQLSKLGQILGELLAIKVILSVAGIGGSLKGVFGGGGGPLGIVGRLFGGNKGGGVGDVSNVAPGSGSVGSNEASVTFDSGGPMDQTLKSNLDSGGAADNTLTKHLAGGGTLDTTLTGFLTKFAPMLAAIGLGAAKGGAAGGLEGLGSNLLGGMFGRMIGGAAGGPIGAAIAGIAIPAIIGMFGPKLNATKNPDILATQQYGQGIANLIGSTGANGQNFTEDPSQLQALGGQTQGDAISAYIKKTGGAGLSAQTVQFFKDWQDGMKSLHNGVVTFANGQSALWSDVLNMANTAMTQIGSTLTTTLQGAASLNIGTTFGNGTVSAVNGGFTVTPGAGVVATGDTSGSGSGSQIMFNIEKIYGADPSTLQEAFQPIIVQIGDQLSRAQAQRTRTQAHAYGRNA